MAPILAMMYGVSELPDAQLIACSFLVKVSYIRYSLIISLTDEIAMPSLTTVTLGASDAHETRILADGLGLTRIERFPDVLPFS
jgi:hypothetical protein